MDNNSIENNAGPEEQKPTVVTLKPVHKHWAVWLLVVLVLGLLASTGYLWMQLQASKKNEQQQKARVQQLEQQVKDLQKAKTTAQADNSETCTNTPSVSFKDNIKAALDSKNTAAFSTYVTNPVKYVLAASEQGGDVTPTVAATNLDYTHNATGPWDFNLSAATLAGYDSGDYTDYFGPKTLVGKASSGMVISFEFNCDGSKISNIFVATNEDLL